MTMPAKGLLIAAVIGVASLFIARGSRTEPGLSEDAHS